MVTEACLCQDEDKTIQLGLAEHRVAQAEGRPLLAMISCFFCLFDGVINCVKV